MLTLEPALPTTLGDGMIRKPDTRPAWLGSASDADLYFKGDYEVRASTRVTLPCTGLPDLRPGARSLAAQGRYALRP